MSSEQTSILSGMRVLDLTSVLLGPYCTQILGDLGADVIKVEPPQGDLIRWGGKAPKTKGLGPIFMNINRNKRSICLDLKDDDAKQVLRDLVQTADVFIHNVRAAGIERLGFWYDQVREIKPDIVYVHCAGYGAGGAYEGRQAYDDLVQAATGTATLLSRFDGNEEPRYLPSLVADKSTGLHAAYATLAGIIHKLRTGEGQFIEVPMMESFTSFTMLEHLFGATFVPPTGNIGYRRVLNPNRRPYKTKDGYLGIVPYSDAQWEEFFRMGGRNDVFDDPKFATFEARTKNIQALYALIEEVSSTKTTDEWIDLLAKANIPAMKVTDLDDIIDDEHLSSVDFFQRKQHPTEGQYLSMKHPVTFEKAATPVRHHPPAIGANSREILEELGYAAEKISKVIGEKHQE